MGIINVLDISVANLIAAGEVVERPASVVKELLENALDAGAKNITVEIKNGGVSLIRVTDDGCGMSKDDLPVCVLRHATSKIHDKQDLNGIKTLGFRGEALAAIASVSRLRIITKQKGQNGHVLQSAGGKVESISETGCADGTSVIVEELFGNVPARRKFLKKDSTEAAAVASVCEKIALSNPEVSIGLISDNVLRFRSNADGNLKNTIYSVLGREFANNMLKIDGNTDGISVYGFIGTPTNCRPNRTLQIFFINGRYVKSRTVQAALEAAVQSYVPHEKFPVAVLNITLHHGFVDVNVHPAKTEVKFSNEKAVFDAVYCIIKSAVDSSTARPELQLSQITKVPPIRFTPIEDGKPESLQKRQISFSVSESAEKTPITEKTDTHKSVGGLQPNIQQKTPLQAENLSADVQNTQVFSKITAEPVKKVPFVPRQTETQPMQSAHTLRASGGFYDTVPNVERQSVLEEKKAPEEYVPTKKKGEYRYCGEFFNTYLIVETENEAYIIDKHAAHERIIFEELKRGVKYKANYAQLLMIPLEVPLSDEEQASAEEYKDEITQTGFRFEISAGMGTITEIPSNLTEGAALDLFITMLSELSQGTGNAMLSRDLIYERALYQSSCKAAIKAGDINSEEELKALVDRLMACPEITHCPHGRPVAFIMTKASIERRFGRT